MHKHKCTHTYTYTDAVTDAAADTDADADTDTDTNIDTDTDTDTDTHTDTDADADADAHADTDADTDADSVLQTGCLYMVLCKTDTCTHRYKHIAKQIQNSYKYKYICRCRQASKILLLGCLAGIIFLFDMIQNTMRGNRFLKWSMGHHQGVRTFEGCFEVLKEYLGSTLV